MCTSCNLTRSLRFHSIANGVPSVFASSLRFVRATSTPHGGMRMDIVRLPHPLVFRSTPTPSRSVPHDPMQSCRAVLSSSSNHPVSLHRAFSFSPFFLLPSRFIPLCLRKHPVKVAFPTFFAPCSRRLWPRATRFLPRTGRQIRNGVPNGVFAPGDPPSEANFLRFVRSFIQVEVLDEINFDEYVY